MVDKCITPDNKILRYNLYNGFTWLHINDVCSVLNIKYQTRKFKDLTTQRFRTNNADGKVTKQRFILLSHVERLYKRSSEIKAIRWISETFHVHYIDKTNLESNKYTDFLLKLFKNESLNDEIKQEIKIFLENDKPKKSESIESTPTPKPKVDPIIPGKIEPEPEFDNITSGSIVLNQRCECYYVREDGHLYIDLETLLGELECNWSALAFENDKNYNTKWFEVERHLRYGPRMVETVFIHYKDVSKLQRFIPEHVNPESTLKQIATLF